MPFIYLFLRFGASCPQPTGVGFLPTLPTPFTKCHKTVIKVSQNVKKP